MRRPEFDQFDLFTAPARLDTPLRHSTAEVTSGENALKEGTPSIMQILLVNFSHILLLCLSKCYIPIFTKCSLVPCSDSTPISSPILIISDVPARLGLKAAALAWPEMALAFSRVGPGHGFSQKKHFFFSHCRESTIGTTVQLI